MSEHDSVGPERDAAIKALADMDRWDVPPKVRQQDAERAIAAIEGAGLMVVPASAWARVRIGGQALSTDEGDVMAETPDQALSYEPRPEWAERIDGLEERAIEAMVELLCYPYDYNDLCRLVYEAMRRAS